jgi:hypothetical protein
MKNFNGTCGPKFEWEKEFKGMEILMLMVPKKHWHIFPTPRL